MSKKNSAEINKWEQILASEGLSPIKTRITAELKQHGFRASSLEEDRNEEFRIKNALDHAIETENMYSSAIPLNRSGLPPCKRARLEEQRSLLNRDPRLRD